MKPQDRINAILNSLAPTSWKAVLMSMASHMNDECRNSRPAVSTMSRQSGLKDRQTRQVIRDMAAAGVITRTDRGYHSPKWNSIEWDILATFAGVAKTARGGKRCQDVVAKTASNGGKDCQDILAKTAPEPTSEPIKEPTSEPNAPKGARHQEPDHEQDTETRRSAATSTEGGSPKVERDREPVGNGQDPRGTEEPSTPRNGTDLVALWAKVNEITPGRALKLNAPRRKALAARVKEYSAEDVLTVVRWVHTSGHKRAADLREGGWTTPDTYLRQGKFTAYIEFAEQEWPPKPKHNGKKQAIPEPPKSDIPEYVLAGRADEIRSYCGRPPPDVLARHAAENISKDWSLYV